jgi:hypothetical protein
VRGVFEIIALGAMNRVVEQRSLSFAQLGFDAAVGMVRFGRLQAIETNVGQLGHRSSCNQATAASSVEKKLKRSSATILQFF